MSTRTISIALVGAPRRAPRRAGEAGAGVSELPPVERATALAGALLGDRIGDAIAVEVG